ncbi:MAG: Thymidylate kinase [candidate division TM6 bacterium GW2011_GWF2_30_66]|jgi:dTMP kinase|nr:MAG: Thymidylate kinase [candidate division TM6 bacterium GW2011_GWF2_30_66]
MIKKEKNLENKLKKGLLVAIEGIDGSGKSTLANKLREKLESDNLDTILTYEPGDSALGKHLRKILQERDFELCGKSEFLLFASDRAQHFQDIIIPSLQKNKIVISDRMADSSVVYQGYGRQEDLNTIKTINKWAMQNIEPDIIFYIQVPLKVALERLEKRNSKPSAFEKEKDSFTKRLVNGFEAEFKDRKNVITLDGQQDAGMLAKIAHANIKLFISKNNLTITQETQE